MLLQYGNQPAAPPLMLHDHYAPYRNQLHSVDPLMLPDSPPGTPFASSENSISISLTGLTELYSSADQVMPSDDNMAPSSTYNGTYDRLQSFACDRAVNTAVSCITIGTPTNTHVFALVGNSKRVTTCSSYLDMEDNIGCHDKTALVIASEQRAMTNYGQLYASTGSDDVYYHDRNTKAFVVPSAVATLAIHMLACGVYLSHDSDDLCSMAMATANPAASFYTVSRDGPEMPEMRVGAAGVATKDADGAWKLKGWCSDEGDNVRTSSRVMLGMMAIDVEKSSILKLTVRSMCSRMQF